MNAIDLKEIVERWEKHECAACDLAKIKFQDGELHMHFQTMHNHVILCDEGRAILIDIFN